MAAACKVLSIAMGVSPLNRSLGLFSQRFTLSLFPKTVSAMAVICAAR